MLCLLCFPRRVQHQDRQCRTPAPCGCVKQPPGQVAPSAPRPLPIRGCALPVLFHPINCTLQQSTAALTGISPSLPHSAGFEPAANNLEGCRSIPAELRTPPSRHRGHRGVHPPVGAPPCGEMWCTLGCCAGAQAQPGRCFYKMLRGRNCPPCTEVPLPHAHYRT